MPQSKVYIFDTVSVTLTNIPDFTSPAGQIYKGISFSPYDPALNPTPSVTPSSSTTPSQAGTASPTSSLSTGASPPGKREAYSLMTCLRKHALAGTPSNTGTGSVPPTPTPTNPMIKPINGDSFLAIR